jgi:hypothetical protein
MQDLWHNFITSGTKLEEHSLEMFRLKLLNMLCLSSVSCLIVLTLHDLLKNPPFFLIFDLIALVTILFIMISLRFKLAIQPLSNLFIYMMVTVASLFFIFCPEKIVIVTVVPVITILLKGKKIGLILSLSYLGWLILLNLLTLLGYLYLPYTYNLLIPTFLAYIFITIFIYMNQGLVETEAQIILEKNHMLQESLKKLEEETKIRRETQEELKTQTETVNQKTNEIKKITDIMTGRERKLAELKKKVVELRTKLGLEPTEV